MVKSYGERLLWIFLNLKVMIGEAKGTEDGLEIHMQVNHLGHFLLTMLLEVKNFKEPSIIGTFKTRIS